jgi:hypothetical protein
MADKVVEPEPDEELAQFLLDQQAQQNTPVQSVRNTLARFLKRK